jgi:hypothetical protein
VTFDLFRDSRVRLGIVFVVALGLRLPFLSWPLIEDEGAYAYIARWWLAGAALYGPDLWLDRPQGIFVAYLPPVLAGGSVWTLRAWGALWAAATGVAVARVAEYFASARAGLLAGLVFAVTSISPFVEGWTVNAECFMLLPATLGFEMLLRRRAGWAGALTAAAVLLKPSGLGLVLLAPFFLRGPRQFARWSAAGAAVGLPFLLHGLWSAGFGGYTYALVGARLSAWSSLDLPHPHPLASSLLTSPAWLGPLLVGASALRRRWRLSVWLAASLAGVLVGGQFYEHYYLQLLPPLAVAAGLELAAFSVTPRALAAAMWTLGLMIVAVSQPAAWWRERDVVAPAVAAYIKSHSRPEDTVYVAFSAANILYLSERRSADRHFFPLHIMSVEGARARLVARLRAKEPRYVIYADRMLRLSPSPWRVFPDDSFDQVLRENYDFVGRIATVPIYHRKAVPPTERAR